MEYQKELGLESVDGISKATTNVNVTFGDYSIKPIEERLAIYGQAPQSGSISIETLEDKFGLI